MNCSTFRQRLLTDPDDQEVEFLHHREHCVQCRDWVRRSERLEEILRRILRVDPPRDLTTHIRTRR